MKGILAGIQSTARFNFVDDAGNIIGTVEAQIPNELAFKLYAMKQIDRAVGAVNAISAAEAIAAMEEDKQAVHVRFQNKQLRSAGFVGHTPLEVVASIGEVLSFPKKLRVQVDGRDADMRSTLRAGQTVDFLPLGKTVNITEKVNQVVNGPTRASLTKPKSNGAKPSWTSNEDRNKALLKDKNQGMSGRELAKKYKMALSTVYQIR